MVLQETVEALARRLDRAVVLYDADLNLVEFSADGAASDDARRLNVLARHASPAAEALIGASGAGRARAPVRIPAIPGARARVLVAIRYADRLLGYLAYIDDADPDAPIPERDAAALAGAVPDIGRSLEGRRLAAQRAREHRSRLLAGLLCPDSGEDPDTAAEALLDGRFVPVAPAYAVAVIRSADRPTGARVQSGEQAVLALSGLLSRVAAFSADPVPWLAHDDHAAVILGCRSADADPGSAPLLARICEAAGEPGETARGPAGAVRIGVGGTRARLADAGGSHREALIAAEASVRSPDRYDGPACWRELGVDRLLARLPLDRMGRDDLPPGVRALLDDRPPGASGTVLAFTLLAYLEHGCDAQATARDLTIHRSTLYYRLGRIRDLTGADLADGRTRLDLHAGLRTAGLLRLL